MNEFFCQAVKAFERNQAQLVTSWAEVGKELLEAEIEAADSRIDSMIQIYNELDDDYDSQEVIVKNLEQQLLEARMKLEFAGRKLDLLEDKLNLQEQIVEKLSTIKGLL